MGRRKGRHKRLFPRNYQANYIPTSRIDSNRAAALNAQRSKPTFGARNDTMHNPNNNFMQDVPRTKSLSTYDEDWDEWIRSERGKVVDRKRDLVSFEKDGLLSLYRVWRGRQRQHGVDPYYCTILKRGLEFKLLLFSKGLEFILVQEFKGERMISDTYNSREEIIRRYHNKRINWVVTKEVIETE